MKYWSKLARPPEDALKKITGGPLKGMTDVSPMWRIKAITEVFGVCGVGWKYEIERVWTEPGSDQQVFAFAQIKLYIKENETWSEPIPGLGGAKYIEKTSNYMRSNDECYKMALTDALSVAMKALGVAAEIYSGKWDGSKYLTGGTEQQQQQTQHPKGPLAQPQNVAGKKPLIMSHISAVCKQKNIKMTQKELAQWLMVHGEGETQDDASKAASDLNTQQRYELFEKHKDKIRELLENEPNVIHEMMETLLPF